MKTVKQVSEITGISIRTLHYYDEIGLLKPSRITGAGYRLYDDGALQILQQILFFRELDFPLKEIRAIMSDPGYDKGNAFAAQRKLIQVKRDRLSGLLELLDRLIRGEDCMSFKEFEMSGYTSALEEFIADNADVIRKYGGNLDEYKRVLETLKSDGPERSEFVKMAVKQFGSMEKYTEAMKNNMARFPELMEQTASMKDKAESYIKKSDELMKRLTADLSKDVFCEEIQQIVGGLIAEGSACQPDVDLGGNYWGMISEGYLSSPTMIEVTDKKYGAGASAFIGNALKAYWNL